MLKHSEIVNQMTLSEKAQFVTGLNYWYLHSFDELGLPSIMMADGPNGLRKQDAAKKTGSIELGNSVRATCFPCAVTSACSWDEKLLEAEGRAMAQECLAERVSVILGPGTNIKRSPVCGRNFEYFSEDPLLAGKMSAALINGCQSKGVGTSLKHFACNSQEAYRMVIDEIIDERAMREIYLTAFEIAVREAQPWTIMNSYNRINGVYASEDGGLQNRIARKEWGFKGVFVTDWGASVDRVPGLKNGTDLEMPSSGTLNTQKIIEAVNSGELDEAVLDTAVDNIAELIKKSKPALQKSHSFDAGRHHKIAQEIAEGSMVLLKNDGGILPLKSGQKVAVIGEMAKLPRYQGAGTSVINPTRLDNAYDELVRLGVNAVYSRGYDKNKDEVRPDFVSTAVKNAAAADVALVFAGLTEGFEAEGYDRKSTAMPACHNHLISEIVKANPNTVVVLAGGSVMEMPWAGNVKGILHSLLGGQAGGAAVAGILTGRVNPSGKTAETYPCLFSDNPTYNNYPGRPVVSEHKESVYIGYRYYDTAGKDVLFPFGYGLSYTTFEYSDIKLSKTEIDDTETVDVTFTITNTGAVDGAEVAQIYVKDSDSTIFCPEKELRAFTKVFLKAGESRQVTLTLGKRAFAYFNVNIGDWHIESGEFEILAAASSRDVRLSAKITVNSTAEAEVPNYKETAPAYYSADLENMTGEQWAAVYGSEIPPNVRDTAKPITIYNCLDDARDTKWGKKIGKIIQFIMTKMGSDSNGDSEMLAAMATQVPIRNFIQMSMGVFSPEMADGLIMILNDDRSTFIGFNKIFWRIGGALLKLPKLLKLI